MPNIIPTARYYPKLSEVITVDDLPEFLSFVEDALNSIFDKIHYKNLQYSKSVNGDAAFYSLEIVSKRLAIKLPFDMALVLNPDLTGNDDRISSFPITLEYQWEILAFLKTFSLEGFSFSLEDFYSVGLTVFRISEDEVLAHIINYFVEPIDEEITKFQQFVVDFNIYKNEIDDYDEINDLELPEEPSVNSLVEAVNALNIPDKKLSLLLFGIYVLDTDLEVTRTKLQQFYNVIVPEGIENYLKKLITPKFKATLALSAGIEFPHKILRPTNEDGTPLDDENAKSVFVFAEAQLYADTQAGIGFQLELGGSLYPEPGFAEILKSGILLQIDTLKIDLSKQTNIPEADADGRPNDFVGVYARAISVTLPSKWFHDDTEPVGNTASTLRLGAYDLLLGSGGISGTILLETVPVSTNTGFHYFNDKFNLIYPVTLSETDPVTKVVKDKKIKSYTELIAYLQLLNEAPIPAPYPFRFPLSLQPLGSNQILQFSRQADYQAYLSTLDNNVLWKRLGGENGFRVGFTKFDIAFKQNKVVSSELIGSLEIPRLKDKVTGITPAKIGIEGHLNEEGDFNLTAKFPSSETFDVTVFDFFTLHILSAELGKQGDDFYIGTSVKLKFESGLIADIIGDQEITIPKLRFYSNGRFEIIGNAGFIPSSITLKLGPVKMAVTGIHTGTIQREYRGNQREYNYIAFNGAINISPLGLDARGEGLKYYYTVDNDDYEGDGDSFIHIQTVEIDLVVSNKTPKFSLHGMLSIPEPGASQEYAGEITYKSLNNTNMAGKASMRLAPQFPAFIFDAELNLPKPIPLGTLSIYAFRGLVGYRYVATKSAIASLPPNATWYDYFKFPRMGVNIKKFKGPYDTSGYTDPFSFGVGATIGTSTDDGKIFALRAMMLMSIPASFSIEGRAYILKGVPKLEETTDPPFWVFISFGENSIEIGMGADYKFPISTGQVMELHANAQGYFPRNNGTGWFLNIGTKQNPNTALIFKDTVSINAMAYLMMASQGIEFGARVSFELERSFFGIRIRLWAFIEVGAKISFERPQFGGYLHFGGGLEVNVWRFIYVGFELNCYLSGEAVKPYLIYAELSLRGRIRVGPIKIKFGIRLQLKWEKSQQVDTSPIPVLGNGQNGSLNQLNDSVKGIHMLTNEEFNIENFSGVPLPNAIEAIIPLDTYIDIKFSKPVNPTLVSSKIGGHTTGAQNFIDLIPPEKTVRGGRVLRQVTHKYSIESIAIYAAEHNDGTVNDWRPYHPYEAVVDPGDRQNVSNFKIGYWQRSGNQYDTIRLLSNNVLSFTDAGEPGWFIPEQYGITASNLFCAETVNVWHTSNMLNRSLGEIYPITGQFAGYYINGAYYYAIGDFEVDPNYSDYVPFNTFKITNDPNTWSYDKSLLITNTNGLLITLPEDAVKAELKINSTSQSVQVKFYKSVVEDGSSFAGFELLDTLTILSGDLDELITIEKIIGGKPVPFIRIEILPVSPELDAINAIREQIEALYTVTYSSASGPFSVTFPSDMVLYQQLVDQLEALLSEGCGSSVTSTTASQSVICQLYRELINLHCFDFPVTDVSQISLDKISLFKSILDNFNDTFGLINYDMNEYYDAFVEAFDELSSNIGNNAADSVILASYAAVFAEVQIIYGELTKNDLCPFPNVRTACTTSFQEIKWKTVADYEYEQTIPGQNVLNEDREDMIAAITNYIQPIWRPNTAYYIHFVLKDLVNNQAASPPIYNYYYGFKTAGPIGHFHDADGVTYGNERNSNGDVINRFNKDGEVSEQGKLANPDKLTLTSLRSYIDYKRSYPNADGDLLRFKPLFYGNNGCRIDLYFTKPFTYYMLEKWEAYNGLSSYDGMLNLAIIDPINEEIISFPLTPEVVQSSPYPSYNGENIPWIEDLAPQLPPGLIALNNLIQSGETNCGLTLGTPISPMSQSFSVSLRNLKPQKLYTAIVRNAFDKNNDQAFGDSFNEARDIFESENVQVHSFSFQTSRYSNFYDQVSSFMLLDENGIYNGKDAVFKIELDLNLPSIVKAYGIISQEYPDNDLELTSMYTSLFDRVFEGVLKFRPLDPAATTEFNQIKDVNTGDVIAILVRNPEPFNNPRIPIEDVQDTIAIMESADAEALIHTEYKVLHSKDYSQAIIMHSSLKITDELLHFRFQYKEWNGTTYVTYTSNDIRIELPIN